MSLVIWLIEKLERNNQHYDNIIRPYIRMGWMDEG